MDSENLAKLNKMNEYLRSFNPEDDLEQDFAEVSKENLRSMLKHLTEIPHLAGDFHDLELSLYIKQKFIEFGLDHAEVKPNNVHQS